MIGYCNCYVYELQIELRGNITALLLDLPGKRKGNGWEREQDSCVVRLITMNIFENITD